MSLKRPPVLLPRVLICLILAVSVRGCSDRPRVVEISGPTMGTFYSVKMVSPPAGLSDSAIRKDIEAVLHQVVALISTYEASSQLSRLNQDSSTEWLSIPSALLAVIEEGQRVSTLTEGAFDITVGPLVNLWGFGPELRGGQIPSGQAIAAALTRVGYQKLHLRDRPPSIRKDRGDVYIDLSGLGEGYGADRIADYLDSQGVVNYMAAIAGAIRVKGRNVRGEPWAIAIEEPIPGQRSVRRVIRVSDGGLSTSGDYRNFFEKDGRRFSHEIDPRTGWPTEHRLGSVTVVSDTAMRADALATALLVMGEDKGPALAEAQGLAAYFIIREATGLSDLSTTRFRPYLEP
jgi:thiamine biosynthesis lipoprotein